MKLPSPSQPVNASPSQNPNKDVLIKYANLDMGADLGLQN